MQFTVTVWYRLNIIWSHGVQYSLCPRGLVGLDPALFDVLTIIIFNKISDFCYNPPIDSTGNLVFTIFGSVFSIRTNWASYPKIGQFPPFIVQGYRLSIACPNPLLS